MERCAHPAPSPAIFNPRISLSSPTFYLRANTNFCVGVLAMGRLGLGLGLATLQTLAFVALVCGNQATMYSVPARGRIWSSPGPSISSIKDHLVII